MPGVPLDAWSQLEKVFNGHKLQHPEAANLQWRQRQSQNVPVTYADIPDSDTEEERDDGAADEMHEGFGSYNTPSRPQLPPSMKSGASGLPPTPPTTNGSDLTQTRAHQTPARVFADGVRNALHAQKSGLRTPEQQETPPTPDPSPPGRMALRPTRPPLSHIASSRAESFMTAKESLGGKRSTPALGRFGSYDGRDSPGVNEQDGSIDWDKHVSYVSDDMEDINWGAIPEEEEVAPLRYTPKKSTTTGPAAGGPMADNDNSMFGMQSPRADLSSMDGLSRDPAFGLEQISGSQRRTSTSIDHALQTVTASASSGAGRHGSRPKYHVPAISPTTDRQQTEINSSKPSDYILAASSPSRSQPRTLHRPRDRTPPPTVPKMRSSCERSSPRALRHPGHLQPNGNNDVIYKQIREAKSDRYDAISNATSVDAHILPTPPSTQRSLRHTGKIPTARQHIQPAPELFGSPSYGSSKAPQLEESPIETPLRPARETSRTLFTEDGSKMTSLTSASLGAYASNQANARNSRPRSSGWQRGDTDRELATPSPVLTRQHPLRHYQREERLENNDAVRRTSQEKTPETAKGQRSATSSPHSNGLRRTSAEHRLEKSLDLPRLSLDRPEKSPGYFGSMQMPKSPASPRRMDHANPRFLLANNTPASTSQMSAATEMEVCEAKGINIYPHNNHSLLVVQQASKGRRQSRSPPAENYLGIQDEALRSPPIFAAVVEPATPPLGAGQEAHVDSPLRNPRAAPAPPVIKFIPPTPGDELDRELTFEEPTPKRPAMPQRRLSLLQKARRYSDTYVQPLFGRSVSTRSRPSGETPHHQRDNYLSPFWRPQRFWDDADSDDYSDSDSEPEESLPRGGDTSNIAYESNRNRGWLPRSMSVRMPGFRGAGGFLIGNSMGIDRHGTNNRRPYVSMPAGMAARHSKEALASRETLALRPVNTHSSSNEILHHALRKKASEEVLRSMASKGSLNGRRVFVVPLTKGMRVEYVGFAAFGNKVRAIRRAREGKTRERRQEDLRRKIGTRTYHDNGVAHGN